MPSKDPLRFPDQEEIDRLRAKYDIPPTVTIRSVTPNINLEKSTGLQSDEVAVEINHLKVLRFPVHPIVPRFLNAVNLNFLQINTNVLRILLGCAVLNHHNPGLRIGIDELLTNYHFQNITRQKHLFYLTLRRGLTRFFTGTDGSESNWRGAPVIIGGEWCTRPCPSIPRIFGKPYKGVPENGHAKVERILSYFETPLAIRTLLTEDNLRALTQQTELGFHSGLPITVHHLNEDPIDVDSPTSSSSLDGQILEEIMAKTRAIAPFSLMAAAATSSAPPPPPARKRRLIRAADKEKTPTPITPTLDAGASGSNEPSSPPDVPLKHRQTKKSGKRARNEDDDSPTDDPEVTRMVKKMRELDPFCDGPWVPEVLKADRSPMRKIDSVRGNPEHCIAVARAFQSPMDALIMEEINPDRACSEAMIAATECFNTQMTLVGVTQRLENELSQSEKRLSEVTHTAAADRQAATRAEAARVRAEEVAQTSKRSCALLEAQLKRAEEKLAIERAAFDAVKAAAEKDQRQADEDRRRLVARFDKLEEFFQRRAEVVGAQAFRMGYEMHSKPESERITPDQLDVQKNLAVGVYPEDIWVDSDAESEDDDEAREDPEAPLTDPGILVEEPDTREEDLPSPDPRNLVPTIQVTDPPSALLPTEEVDAQTGELLLPLYAVSEGLPRSDEA